METIDAVFEETDEQAPEPAPIVVSLHEPPALPPPVVPCAVCSRPDHPGFCHCGAELVDGACSAKPQPQLEPTSTALVIGDVE